MRMGLVLDELETTSFSAGRTREEERELEKTGSTDDDGG